MTTHYVTSIVPDLNRSRGADTEIDHCMTLHRIAEQCLLIAGIYPMFILEVRVAHS